MTDGVTLQRATIPMFDVPDELLESRLLHEGVHVCGAELVGPESLGLAAKKYRVCTTESTIIDGHGSMIHAARYSSRLYTLCGINTGKSSGFQLWNCSGNGGVRGTSL